MINKVNKPPVLSLIQGSKAPNHDPGSSQGGALSYDGNPNSESEAPLNDAASKDPLRDSEGKTTPRSQLSTVSVEQVGMTEVVTDLLEHKKENAAPPAAGLTTRYSSESGTIKGMLLNKKAE